MEKEIEIEIEIPMGALLSDPRDRYDQRNYTNQGGQYRGVGEAGKTARSSSSKEKNSPRGKPKKL